MAVAVVLLAAPAATAARSAAPTNLIKNGGFELPVVPSGSYQLFSHGQSFPGWMVVGAGNVAPISGAFVEGGFKFDAKAGKQWIDMTGLSNSATGVVQTVRTVRGARYTLTFAVGNVVDRPGGYGTRSTIKVLVNGRKVLAATNTGGSTTQAWKSFSVSFKAASKATTVEFLNGDASNDNDDGLDAVTLTKR